MSERILISGASGYVGAVLAAHLSRSAETVRALSGTRRVPEAVERQGVECVAIDLADADAVMQCVRSFSPSIVIHAAAMANASLCEDDPSAAHVHNVLATKHLAQAVEHLQDTHFFHFSTDLVFDGAEEAPDGGFTEGDSCCPKTVYGRTKREAEECVLSLGHRGTILRLSLVYGLGFGERHGFIQWLYERLRNEEPVPLFFDEWRTPVYINDVASLIECLISAVRTRVPIPPILHVSGSERLSRLAFGQRFAEALGVKDELITPTPQSSYTGAAHRPRDVSLNNKAVTELLEFEWTPCKVACEKIARELAAT